MASNQEVALRIRAKQLSIVILWQNSAWIVNAYIYSVTSYIKASSTATRPGIEACMQKSHTPRTAARKQDKVGIWLVVSLSMRLASGLDTNAAWDD